MPEIEERGYEKDAKERLKKFSWKENKKKNAIVFYEIGDEERIWASARYDGMCWVVVHYWPSKKSFFTLLYRDMSVEQLKEQVIERVDWLLQNIYMWKYCGV